MWKTVLALLMCLLMLGTTAALAEEETQAAANGLTGEEIGLFEQALEGLLGVQYEPVALVESVPAEDGQRLVYLTRATVVYPGAVPAYALVTIHADAQGQAALTDIQSLTDVLAAAQGDGLHASTQPVVDSPDWVKALPEAQDENVRQLFVVAGYGMEQTGAHISLHQRDEHGDWKRILSTPGFVGKLGLCLDADHAEGCAQTPIGTYHFNAAFGIAADPGCAIPYTQVDEDIYWSGDEQQRYNEMVRLSDYPTLDMENSEHIIDYEYQYQYCLNISFNEDGTPGRGSAIFLHCMGLEKPYTGGCVAIPENIMKQVMQLVREDCVVVIDTMENMNVTF